MDDWPKEEKGAGHQRRNNSSGDDTLKYMNKEKKKDVNMSENKN